MEVEGQHFKQLENNLLSRNDKSPGFSNRLTLAGLEESASQPSIEARGPQGPDEIKLTAVRDLSALDKIGYRLLGGDQRVTKESRSQPTSRS